MTNIHRRVSRRLTSFLSNSKSADRVAAEIIRMVAAQGTEAQRATTVEQDVVHDGPVRDSECAQTSSGGGANNG